MTLDEYGAAVRSQIRLAIGADIPIAFALVSITQSEWDTLDCAGRVSLLGRQAVEAIEHADPYRNDGDPED